MLEVNDALNVISGKWKLPILGVMRFGKKRFGEIRQSIPKITPRMLSKELKELELNGVIIRSVYDSTPIVVEYELTQSGRAIKEVIDKMVEWGYHHRRKTFAK